MSAQWPLFHNVYAVGRVNYSTRDHKPIETLAGFEYGGCCWVVRVVGSRYVTGTQTATSTLFLQLELNGLARLGSNPLESLKRNVPGYQLVNQPPPVRLALSRIPVTAVVELAHVASLEPAAALRALYSGLERRALKYRLREH